ncbi:MAG: hypothetical protein GC179_20670 [Anaerolineaceae bacterium]|nr:hypothetical protein [Anaerolineaceae bacterium]
MVIMTDWVKWFREHLRTSGEGFEWAFSQINPALHKGLPPNPRYLGLWQPARHVWHITEYERCLVIPSMQQWLGGAMLPDDEDIWPDNDEAWQQVQDNIADEFIAAFHDIRQQQINLLDQLVDVDWDTPRETIWGMKPLSMVVTKTYQHTFEHGDTLLRMGLWWEEMARKEAEYRAQNH